MTLVGLSVLITVYAKESPAFLARALESIEQQTLPASEVVLVQDGLLGDEFQAVVSDYIRRLPMKVVDLPNIVGRGSALRIGVDQCRGPLIAIMDSDDICASNRFASQLHAFEQDPSLDGVGSAIAEFVSSPANPVAFRRPPESSDKIARWAKSRNPMNHMTVMFRRDAVLQAGSYLPFVSFEDYHLMVRMLMAGSRFINLPEVLVYVRVGNGMLGRRRGFWYARTEIAFQRFLCTSGFISRSREVWNALVRLPVRLAPPSLGHMVYRYLLRAR
jgi:glycosyltransferase involved in cell wall biosynthesis